MGEKKKIAINFNDVGEGQMELFGFKSFRCLGKKGHRYPKDSTIDPARHGTKQNPHYSQRYTCGITNDRGQCRMDYSILIQSQFGVYIHSWPTPATLAGNGGETHGCIHLDEENAPLVYHWIDRPTHLLISYPW